MKTKEVLFGDEGGMLALSDGLTYEDALWAYCVSLMLAHAWGYVDIVRMMRVYHKKKKVRITRRHLFSEENSKTVKIILPLCAA